MIPILLYPETHFRFGGISPSLLFKREPEILFDTPARCLPGNKLPLYLLLNDIDRFPITIERLEVALTQKGIIKRYNFSELNSFQTSHPTNNLTMAFEIPLDISPFQEGRLAVAPLLHIRTGNRRQSILTDNIRTASHQPLTVYIAKEEYPGSPKCQYGDMHCHSIHSRSHVEFGAPVSWYRSAAKVSGLSLVSIIDHSYDLEARPDNYLKRDLELTNWKLQQAQQDQSQPLILLSQEHSARKARGGVVHMGVIGYKKLLKGSGDGARKKYQRASEPTLEEASKRVCQSGGITFAAHPGEPTTQMQRIFLRRDNWQKSDFTQHITAFQALNRGLDASWYRARKMWISLLLNDKKLPLLAGNDAHGDFNRYRAIAYPFISVKEDFHRYFGLARTGFYGAISTENELIKTIREGKTFITTGPFVDIQSKGESKIGNRAISPQRTLVLIIESSEEFGKLKRVRLHCGKKHKEETYLVPTGENSYQASLPVHPQLLLNTRYIRVEVETECGNNGLEAFAATSPLYLKNMP